MDTIFLINLCIGLSAAVRGPHHPRSTVSHNHYSPRRDVKITQDAELLQDTTHLKEDMGPMAEELDFSKMTTEEIEFHYFRVHDIDNNSKLDGLEILHAIQHTFHENEHADAERTILKKRTSEDTILGVDDDELLWIVAMVDTVLREDDLNNDGYVCYTEYVLGRQRGRIVRAERQNKLRIGE